MRFVVIFFSFSFHFFHLVWHICVAFRFKVLMQCVPLHHLFLEKINIRSTGLLLCGRSLILFFRIRSPLVYSAQYENEGGGE